MSAIVHVGNVPDAKRRQREIEELIMAGYDAKEYTHKDLDLMRAGEELTAKDECIAALEAALAAKDEERLEAEGVGKNLAAQLSGSEKSLRKAEAALAEFKSRHTAAGCGMDAATGSLSVITTGVGT